MVWLLTFNIMLSCWYFIPAFFLSMIMHILLQFFKWRYIHSHNPSWNWNLAFWRPYKSIIFPPFPKNPVFSGDHALLHQRRYDWQIFSSPGFGYTRWSSNLVTFRSIGSQCFRQASLWYSDTLCIFPSRMAYFCSLCQIWSPFSNIGPRSGSLPNI